MTTQEALDTITSVITGLQNSISGEQRQIEAYTIAQSQLRGILDTPSADLEEAQTALSTLKAELEAAKTKVSA